MATPTYLNRTAVGPHNPYDANDNPGGQVATDNGTNAGLALKALAETTGMPLLGSSSGSGGYGAGGDGTAPPIQFPNTTGGTDAAFARGKDQAGMTARAALNGLQEEMSGRGMAGSGQEAMATADVVGRAASGVNEISREQAVKDAQFGNQMALENYKGSITQRGQDINAKQEAARQQQNALQGLMSVIQNGSGFLY